MDDRCRVCRVGQETITHLLSGCDNLARKEYIERHDNVGRYVHMKVCNYYSISTPSNWYLHKPKDVIICKMVEIVWNQVILTDRPCGANKPDMVIKDMVKKKVYLIDFACPADVNVVKKEYEKKQKYRALQSEVSRMWNMPVVVIPVVVGALGAVSNILPRYLSEIPGNPDLHLCQKISMLG